jgi:NTP pyrophosphatase (non-canonical NTP hydrolase)
MLMDYLEVRKKAIDFRNDRNWGQFHKIKDLLIGLNIEVSELQEIFLWKDEEQLKDISKDKVKDELADVFTFVIYIAEHYGIDLIEALNNKIDKNGIKYPIEKSYNSNKKYSEL